PGGFGAGGKDDVFGSELPAVDVDVAGAGQAGGALDDRGALLAVAVGLGGIVQVADHVVAVVAYLRPVEGGPLETGGVGGFRACLGGAEQGLGGDAGPVGALSADQFLFDDGDAPV